MTSQSSALLLIIWQCDVEIWKSGTIVWPKTIRKCSGFIPAVFDQWIMHMSRWVEERVIRENPSHTLLLNFRKILVPGEQGIWPRQMSSYAKTIKEPQLCGLRPAKGLDSSDRSKRHQIYSSGYMWLRINCQIYESLIGFIWAALKSNWFTELEFKVYFQSLIYYKDKQTKFIFQTSPVPRVGIVYLYSVQYGGHEPHVFIKHLTGTGPNWEVLWV